MPFHSLTKPGLTLAPCPFIVQCSLRRCTHPLHNRGGGVRIPLATTPAPAGWRTAEGVRPSVGKATVSAGGVARARPSVRNVATDGITRPRPSVRAFAKILPLRTVRARPSIASDSRIRAPILGSAPQHRVRSPPRPSVRGVYAPRHKGKYTWVQPTGPPFGNPLLLALALKASAGSDFFLLALGETSTRSEAKILGNA